MINKHGLITKAIAGFYYVAADNKCYECKARGVFRNQNQSPMVGDYVDIEIDENNKGVVVSVDERKNSFLRPPLANLDKLFIVVSTCNPTPSFLVIDKLIAVCEYKEIEPIIIITKTDLKEADELVSIYRNAGFQVIALSNEEAIHFDEVKSYLQDSISAFIGNTGVGKSSLLNNIFPELKLETSHISKKLGRGRHTTRHVELFAIEGLNGYVADTPGFGSMEITRYDIIFKDQLQYCFREFEPYLQKCKFTGCSHTSEKGCEVLKALENGEIERTRFESYVAMYEDAKNLKEWELK
ncbi:ribosome small subunit-dependent GTPase A [Paludicola sp. MB14-C6]|uniref:ribosome small subunit-dependent GTPase A n=1 Tax=Paludihabitans sp. MB14-C6 TaxID=3070656 RepID=UPI0027DE4D43|nr:ribosome small subunit-dependent GTPase A [Paludicola sp. MB14-C6]WMJ22384.1 ribosome small subunit-dependent GTPase A [Paludicola sp. MB14-C6]